MEPDQALLEQARRYNTDALTEIYDCYNAEIYRYAMRLLGNADLADECVAETFSRFLSAIKNGGGPRQYLRAYLYRTAHNWIADHYRRPGPAQVDLDLNLADTTPEPEEAAAHAAERRRVRAALHCLTPEQQQVIVLRYIEGWSLNEVAQALKKPVGAVKALQHRALNALRRYFVTEGDLIR